MLTRAEIEERWIGCCSDPEYFKRELEALETAKRLGEWHRILNSERQPLKESEALEWLVAAAQVNAWLEGREG